MCKVPRSIVVLVVLLVVVVGGAQAQTVQLTPFAGFQFGGSFVTPAGAGFSLSDTLDYGGSLDISVSKTFRVGLFYSRQETDLRGPGPSFDLTVERLMGTVSEEKGEGNGKFFGEVLVGVTRYVPALSGFDSDSNFTLGAGLGLKQFFSRNFGLRAEARGFFTFTETNGGAFCNGGDCLFLFSGSGLWQGELSAGLILAF